jgi:hypothetical protein
VASIFFAALLFTLFGSAALASITFTCNAVSSLGPGGETQSCPAFTPSPTEINLVTVVVTMIGEVGEQNPFPGPTSPSATFDVDAPAIAGVTWDQASVGVLVGCGILPSHAICDNFSAPVALTTTNTNVLTTYFSQAFDVDVFYNCNCDSGGQALPHLQVTYTAVAPEPGTLAATAVGFLAIALLARKSSGSNAHVGKQRA